MTDTVSSTEVVPRDLSAAAVRADNLIRQRLRIGDPRDPLAVAEGLKRLFPKDARSLAFEAEGVPFLPASFAAGPAGTLPRAPESLATGAELAQAVADVERDLAALTTDHRLKDISVELQGWGQAIRGIVADGTAAARLALDPHARDRVFAARRQLGDYARLARMVGALTQTMSLPYRKLAQSLDEVAGLLLVLAGEVLAGSGLGGGRFLLSVPASELQARRDAVLGALRTLSGTTEQSYGNDQWPWGLNGLREALNRIEASGHLELRALLDEAVLGRLMDGLIEQAAQHRVLGLRALSAISQVTVRQLDQLIHVIDDVDRVRSPGVATLLTAIQLFLDAFRSSRSGYRLLFVARAPISFYGLTGIGGPDAATRRLIDLVIQRGRLAELLDCGFCECRAEDVLCQIQLDRLLYDTDRAIDLYVLGSDPDGRGEPESRAAGYGALIRGFLQGPVRVGQPCLDGTRFAGRDDLVRCLEAIGVLLLGDMLDQNGRVIVPQPRRPTMIDELCLQRLSDRRLEGILATLAPGCVSGSLVIDALDKLHASAMQVLGSDHVCVEAEVTLPPTTEESLEIFHKLYDKLHTQGFL